MNMDRQVPEKQPAGVQDSRSQKTLTGLFGILACLNGRRYSDGTFFLAGS
jgi:hypothetical protein